MSTSMGFVQNCTAVHGLLRAVGTKLQKIVNLNFENRRSTDDVCCDGL